MKSNPEVLIVSRPIAPPWDEGSKNLIHQITSQSMRIRFKVMTFKNSNQQTTEWRRFEKIYTNLYGNGKVNVYELPLYNKLELLKALLLSQVDSEIFHFFFGPTALTSSIFREIVRYKKKLSIQTVPSTKNKDQAIEKLLFANRVVVISDYMKNRLHDNGFKNVVKIPPGIDTEKLKPGIDTQSYKNRFNIDDDRIVFLFAAHFRDRWLVYFLLEIIEKTYKKHPQILFVVAGRQVSSNVIRLQKIFKREVSKRKLSAHVLFLNEVEDMPQLINLCDVYLHVVQDNSMQLEIPLLLLECFSCEKPAIISNLPSFAGLVSEGTGLEVSLESIDPTVSAIATLVKDQAQREQMGKNARAFVLKNHAIKKIAARYEELYLDLLR